RASHGAYVGAVLIAEIRAELVEQLLIELHRLVVALQLMEAEGRGGRVLDGARSRPRSHEMVARLLLPPRVEERPPGLVELLGGSDRIERGGRRLRRLCGGR